MRSDGEMLQAYAESRSEEAFAELVGRHVDVVYSAALRQLNGDAHLAEDVAQTVFTDLARKAASLSHRGDVAGWLYTSTHFAAAKAVRTARRRLAREQEAHAMQEMLRPPTTDLDWDAIRPVLDAVMHELKEADREAILMRYFENHQLSEIGERLGIGEEAARKRVGRALEKLRAFLLKRGISTTAAVATVLSSHAVQVAPAGLAATLSTAAVAGSAGSGAVLTFIKLMTMTKLKVGVVSALAVAGVTTTLIVQHQSQARLRAENALQQETAELDRLRAENERLSNVVAGATAKPSLSDQQLNELLKLRGEMTNLRKQTNELSKLRAENQRLKASSSPTASSKAPASDGIPRESWAFAGFADPESGFQSAVWARSRGDAQNLIAALAPGEESEHWKGKTPQEVERLAAEAKADFEGVTAFKILEKEMVSADEAILYVFAEGIQEKGRFRMLRIGNEWKFGGPIKGEGHNDDGKPKLVKKVPTVREGN